jgi:stearoyl-CoA desaturase (delta-9 desaturase)
MKDVMSDPIVEFQSRYIGWGYVWFGFLMPLLMGWYYGDVVGGFMWPGVFARIISWNGIFSVNSLSHWMGGSRYSDHTTARGNLLCAILGNGEGNHNYHHEFPKDYRHGVQWYEWDPTKWAVYVLSLFGFTFNLWRSNPQHVRLCELQMKEKKAVKQADEAHSKTSQFESLLINSTASSAKIFSCALHAHNGDPARLPTITWDEIKKRVEEEGVLWVVIDNFVLDLSTFKDEHPGGSGLLRAFRGRDATDAFHGGLNNHTNTAHNMTKPYRIARLQS